MAGARSRQPPFDPRCVNREGRRAESAAAALRPARHRRSDGDVFPQQRSERRLLSRADRPRDLPHDFGDTGETEAEELVAKTRKREWRVEDSPWPCTNQTS